MRSKVLVLVATTALAAGIGLGCGDPLRDQRIESLGEEDPNFPPGPLHRVGQPCTWCHSEYGGDDPEFGVAGTIFVQPVDGEPLVPAPGLLVRIYDTDGAIRDIPTNACGNFYVEKSVYDPGFPLLTELYTTDNQLVARMGTRIGREGSCGACHAHPVSAFSPGVAFAPAGALPEDFSPPAPGTCPPPRFYNPNPTLGGL